MPQRWSMAAPMAGCLLAGLCLAGRAEDPPAPNEQVTRLTRSYFSKFFLRYSPDGSQIAYSRHYPNRRHTDQILFGLHVVRSDGTDDRRLLAEYDARIQIQEHPAWSPDGRVLLISGGGNDTGNSAKATFRCDIDEQFRATNLREVVPGDSVGTGEEPCWSPDGKRFVVTTTTEQLLIFNADGSERTQVLQVDGQYCHQPDWSPDGEWIAFASDRDGDVELYKVRWDGTEPTRLTDSPGVDSRPRWSPDAQWLLFSSNRAGSVDLFVMRSNGSDVRHLTEHPALDDHGAWSPDGRSIAFVSLRDGGFDLYRLPVPADLRVQPKPLVPARSTAPQGDLVAHYSFDEIPTKLVRDQAGRSHMTLVGAELVGASGRGALRFGGQGAHATCGNAADLRLSGPSTISLWVRPQQISGNSYLVSKYGWNIYLGGDGLPRFETRTAANDAWDTLTAADQLAANAWSFVTVVFDPAAAKQAIYVDGRLSAERKRTDGSIGGTATHPLELGHYNASCSQHFHGWLDELRVYRQALSPAEVREQFEQQRTVVPGGSP